jgi:uncharacterized protein
MPMYQSPAPDSVHLLDGDVLERQRRNASYLLSLDPDRLLHTVRCQAGLASSAEPLGGWESPDCGLRGHFVGHYLSACAHAFAATRDESIRGRLKTLIAGLAECQSRIGNGYLGALPESDFDVIETQYEGAWAPYYVLHKMLAGLLDVHTRAAVPGALDCARRLGDYVSARLEKLSPDQIERMCRTDRGPNPTNEYGGIGESLQDLADITGEERHERASRFFDRAWFVDPLTRREDRLTGLHANTHIPMALSLLRRFERQGNRRLLEAVRYFWEITALARSFVNGGSTGPRPDRSEKSVGAEHWPEPFRLSTTLTPKNNESCVTHNMLRLTDALFRITGERQYADFYERAYLNHVLTMQQPASPGGYLYDHALSPGSRKKFGEPERSFWCCYGTTVEAYARLTAGIYYFSGDPLRINLFVASKIDWRETGITLTLSTTFPESPTACLSVRCKDDVACEIVIRRPPWSSGPRIHINGQPVHVSANEARLLRVWRNGDVVSIDLAPRLELECMPDDPRMIAFRYGPYVLAAQTGSDLRLDARTPGEALSRVRETREGACGFQTELVGGEVVQLVPLCEIVDESFGVYFTLADR